MKKFNENGFTLIEIIISITILGAGLVTVLGLFSGGLRTAAISNDYSTALFLAQKKMGEIELEKTITNSSGNFSKDGFDNYQWAVTVSPYSFPLKSDEKIKISILKAQLIVSWKFGKKINKVELTTLKTFL